MPKIYCHGQSTFKKAWLMDPELKAWILEVPNSIHTARCRYCPAAVISLSSMGRQALTSHMKGKKHINGLQMSNSPTIGAFLRGAPASAPAQTVTPLKTATPSHDDPATEQDVRPSTSSCVSSTLEPLGMRGMKQYLLNHNVTKAEIIWCIHTVMSHMSFRSAGLSVQAMKIMFPDSAILEKLELQRTKLSYVISFGLAPYFSNELTKAVERCPCFVISFDESLNKVSVKQQMDIIVRFWDNEKNEVATRYLTSQFLDSATAANLQTA